MPQLTVLPVAGIVHSMLRTLVLHANVNKALRIQIVSCPLPVQVPWYRNLRADINT